MPGFEDLWRRQEPPPAQVPQRQHRWRVSAQTVAVPALAAASTVLLARVVLKLWQQRQAGPPATPRKSAARQAGQSHVFGGWEGLTGAGQQQLAKEVEGVDFHQLHDKVRRSKQADQAGDVQPAASQDVLSKADVQASEQTFRSTGLQLLAEGKVAVVLLAGGQGTRLGSSAPKGCYDIGLPSQKSLFQLQAERLVRLQHLAAAHAKAHDISPARSCIPWYIMTSPATHEETKAYFQKHSFFGLQADQVVFFQQGMLPCVTAEGKIIMASAGAMATAPDGNGGMYAALQRCGVLADMRSRGVQRVDCFSVDNALIQPASPVFLGACAQHDCDCGAKVVAKARADEKVGVFMRRGGRLQVVEYSEMTPQDSAATEAGTGELRYRWSNVCMHHFSLAFLERMAGHMEHQAPFHQAHKSIPSLHGPVKGIKLEQFIFDTFPEAERPLLVEVAREEEFAPVKNANGAAADTPDSARRAILQLHSRWVKQAGGKVLLADSEAGVEVSPLVSYSGEDLEPLCAQRTFRQPFDVFLQSVMSPSLLERRKSNATKPEQQS